jgi:soluble lytic murein transglycosylase
MSKKFVVPLSLAALSVGWTAACAEQRVTGPPPSQSTARPFESASAAPTVQVAEAAPPPSPPVLEKTWQEAVRVERWSEAAEMIDALPDADQGRPEIKYVRARVAIALGDGGRAVTLLSGLEADLPVISADIARYRAEGQLLSGPFLDAAEYFGKSNKARDMTKTAQAFARAGQFDKARATADRAVVTAQRARQKREEAAARMARARIRLERGGQPATDPDLRWVAVNAPHTTDGQDAAAALERAKNPLSSKERMQVIDALLDVASPEATTEIARVSKAAPMSGPQLHTRAMSLYKARSYAEAAKLFDEAAARHMSTEAEDLYYAGRAHARSDKADEAIERFKVVMAKFKQTPFNERASYLLARLYLQNGRHDEAIAAYTSYIRNFRRGDKREECEYERALAQLSSSDPKAARKSLRELRQKARGDEVNKLRQLEALASLRAGERDEAIALWTEVARTQPLSWAALMSRARLLSVGAPVPPLLEAPMAVPLTPLEVRLPPAAALLASIGLDADAETYLVQKEREASSRYGGREHEALCSMYGQLSRAKRRYRLGIHAVSSQLLSRAPSRGERWAWECLYPQPFAAHVRALEEEHTVPRGLVYALMRQESAFDPAVVSPASAVGLMQLMPGTAKQCASELSIDYDHAKLTSPEVNLRFGAFYIGKLLKMFQGNVVLASAAYNAGPRAVSSWTVHAKDNDADLWVARIPYEETRNYVAKVAGNLARYQYLQGGESAVTQLSLALPADAKAPPDAY